MTAPASGPPVWEVAGRSLPLDRPLIVGILNVTPDSFSDGGELPDVGAVLRRARRMLEEGAGMLDVGGESTRPGARPVLEEEELERVLPAIEALSGSVPVPLSVDTRKARVAREALRAGASVVNDVSGLTFDPALADAVAEQGAGLVLMHMRGTPEDMGSRARYGDVTGEVARELEAAVDRASRAGIPARSVVLDPGIGFAKTADQSLRVLAELDRLQALGFPLMVGLSRKSFLGEILGVPPGERVVASVAACVMAYLQGARIFRVHDVEPTAHGLAVARAVTAAARGRPVGGSISEDRVRMTQ